MDHPSLSQRPTEVTEGVIGKTVFVACDANAPLVEGFQRKGKLCLEGVFGDPEILAKSGHCTLEHARKIADCDIRITSGRHAEELLGFHHYYGLLIDRILEDTDGDGVRYGWEKEHYDHHNAFKSEPVHLGDLVVRRAANVSIIQLLQKEMEKSELTESVRVALASASAVICMHKREMRSLAQVARRKIVLPVVLSFLEQNPGVFSDPEDF